MLVEEVSIPHYATRVWVRLTGPPRLAGKAGIAWPENPAKISQGDWLLIIPGMPSVTRCKLWALCLELPAGI